MMRHSTSRMWKEPWGYKEGFACGVGLLIAGLLLQVTIGGVRWDLLAWPCNIIVLVLYLFLLVAMHALRKRVYGFEWLSHYTSAVSSLIFVAVITVVMGCIRQVPSNRLPVDLLGLSKMLSFWPFVLFYIWLVSALGLTVLRVGFPLKARKIPFLLNHAGLFIVLLTATLGHADLQRLRMITRLGKAEWRAAEENGRWVELPLAIELKDFTIHEYPPKLMLADNETGHALPANRPEHLLLEDGVKGGRLSDWEISLLQSIPMAASAATEDTLNFTESHSKGAVYAAYLKATNTKTGHAKEGWVSDGSFMFPHKVLRLTEENSLLIPEREPRRFVSSVTVHTPEGSVWQDTVEVNHPLRVGGWYIYQLSYDKTRGRWSDISIFELVRDPWLPAVYVGFIMMMLGAVCLFVYVRRGRDVFGEGLSGDKKVSYGRWKYKWLFGFSFLLSLVFVCILFGGPIRSKTPMPALQSPWFTPHVFAYMFAYLLLGAAAVMAVYLLWFSKRGIGRREMDLCDCLTYVGLAFMTLGILSGAIWAKAAWGDYWTWDPKETWAAATWFSYLGYVHFRLGRPSAYRKAFIGLLVSFLFLQMCWYGINYLPSAQGVSVHTYR